MLRPSCINPDRYQGTATLLAEVQLTTTALCDVVSDMYGNVTPGAPVKSTVSLLTALRLSLISSLFCFRSGWKPPNIPANFVHSSWKPESSRVFFEYTR